MFDVICIGNLNFDIIFKTKKFPDIHEKMRCEDVTMGLGGAAGNTANWLASLQRKVGFIGCVGNDVIGEQHLSEFKRKKIDISQIKTVDVNTGMAIVFSKENDKRIIKTTGANNILSVDEKYLCKTRHVHMSSNKRKTVEKVIEICKKNKITMSYDPGETLYLDLFKEVNYLILNEDEARKATNSDKIEKAISLLHVDRLIITKNHGGCTIKEKKTRYDVNSFGIIPIDTTGAGDAFDAGFIHGLLNNMPIKRCGLFGVAAASIKVQNYGARSGNISHSSIEQLIEKSSI